MKTSTTTNLKENEKKACVNCGRDDVQLKNCAACGSVWYCNAECQRNGWRSHKVDCKEKEKEKKREMVRINGFNWTEHIYKPWYTLSGNLVFHNGVNMPEKDFHKRIEKMRRHHGYNTGMIHKISQGSDKYSEIMSRIKTKALEITYKIPYLMKMINDTTTIMNTQIYISSVENATDIVMMWSCSPNLTFPLVQAQYILSQTELTINSIAKIWKKRIEYASNVDLAQLHVVQDQLHVDLVSELSHNFSIITSFVNVAQLKRDKKEEEKRRQKETKDREKLAKEKESRNTFNGIDKISLEYNKNKDYIRTTNSLSHNVEQIFEEIDEIMFKDIDDFMCSMLRTRFYHLYPQIEQVYISSHQVVLWSLTSNIPFPSTDIIRILNWMQYAIFEIDKRKTRLIEFIYDIRDGDITDLCRVDIQMINDICCQITNMLQSDINLIYAFSDVVT